ncbi:MAG: hypothetical protein WBD95_25740 [Xanthobacteraceae bacterium]
MSVPSHVPLTEAEAKSGETLLTTMGNVLAIWQGIEHGIADIYLTFFVPMAHDPAAVAFYAIRTFDGRSGVVSALIKYYCSDSQNEQWADLKALLRKRSQARNAVAHGVVMRHGRPPNTEFVVGPSTYDISDFPDPPLKNGFYTVKELRELCVCLVDLTQRLDAFREVLASDQALRAKCHALSSKVASHQVRFPLRILIPPELRRPPEPSRE